MKTSFKALNAITSFAFAALLLAPFAGQAQRQEQITGNGKMKKEKREASAAIDEISTSGKFKVYITQGSTPSIELEADENLLPYIEARIDGDELHLGPKRGYNLKTSSDIIARITVVKLESLAGSGTSGFYTEGVVKGDKLEVALSGRGDADLNLQYRKLEVGISGNGKVKLQGRADDAEIGISGSGAVTAPDLQTQQMELGISGSGEAYVNASKKLDVSVSGSGSVKYKGAASVNQAISGKGRIEHEN